LTAASSPRRIRLSVYNAHEPEAKKTTPLQKLSPMGAEAELRITEPAGTSGRGGGGGVMGGSGGCPGGVGGGGLKTGPASEHSRQHWILVRPACAEICDPDSEMAAPPP
jgi:hypothetical protein